MDLDFIERFEFISCSVLLQRNARQLGFELEISMLLKSLLDKRHYRLLVRDHSRDDRLLHLRADHIKLIRRFILVFRKAVYRLYAGRIDVFQAYAVLM